MSVVQTHYFRTFGSCSGNETNRQTASFLVDEQFAASLTVGAFAWALSDILLNRLRGGGGWGLGVGVEGGG